MSTYSISSTNRFAKIAALAVLSAAVAVTTGCATKRATSEIVVAPLGIPGGQVGYNGGVLVNNSNAILGAAENLQAVVYFAFDSSEITSQAAGILNQHANLLSSNPSASVLIAGNTDERGSREYNIALGERRAQAVRSALTQRGVDGARISARGYGKAHPVADNGSADGRAMNRRVEIVIADDKGNLRGR